MSGHSAEYLNKHCLVKPLAAFDETGKQVKKGDFVTDRHGNVAEFIRATRAAQPGKSGKVVVHRIIEAQQGEYYDKVFGLQVKEV